jgi:hypothetical protein
LLLSKTNYYLPRELLPLEREELPPDDLLLEPLELDELDDLLGAL